VTCIVVDKSDIVGLY